MPNKRYNTQVTNRFKAMGGGMGRRMYSKGTPKPDFLDIDKDKNTKESMKKAAADKKSKGNVVNRMTAKGGTIPPQLRKFIEAKKKNKKEKKPSMMMAALKGKK
jgi:hypothetical protein